MGWLLCSPTQKCGAGLQPVGFAQMSAGRAVARAGRPEPGGTLKARLAPIGLDPPRDRAVKGQSA
ncbi:MAG: hypothetical protein GDA36_13685 [Rhodobacteraceae bacterium]|nr:hypothetical protein [Paracoccaceae bacterium]